MPKLIILQKKKKEIYTGKRCWATLQQGVYKAIPVILILGER